MQLLYVYISTILGVGIGFLSGWITAMAAMMIGYGMYSFLLGAIVWTVISILGFGIGLYLAFR